MKKNKLVRIYILLFITLLTNSLFGQAPDWQITASKYAHYMTVVGTININEKVNNDSLNVLGAFINDSLRGVASPTILSNNKAVYLLMIYNNNLNKEIHFKAYIALKDSIVDLSNILKFQANGSIGSPDQPYIFTTTPTTVFREGKTNDITGYYLSQNYPNPFNPETIINYQIPRESHVLLKIYNSTGKEIMTLVDSEKMAGRHSSRFRGSDLASGLYFYELKVGNYICTKKMLLLK